MGDEEKLGQVFLNLIMNAIQAVSGKGTVILQTNILAAQNQVEIKVIDDGPGIPDDYRKCIFDPFFTTKDRGTGLGLSICHSIVEQHNGSITALPIIMITAYAEVKSAVEAMKTGVYDYVTKPLDNNDLLFAIKRALEKQELVQEVERLRNVLNEQASLSCQ